MGLDVSGVIGRKVTLHDGGQQTITTVVAAASDSDGKITVYLETEGGTIWSKYLDERVMTEPVARKPKRRVMTGKAKKE